MKFSFLILLFLLSLSKGNAQGNRVFSGGELINYGIVNISVVGGLQWSSERASLPGYYSVVNAAAYTGCSDQANINGYIKKYGNTGFIFPVGSGTDIRTLEISAPASITDAYATAWIAGNPGSIADPTAPFAGTHPLFAVIAPISAVSPVGQWDWQVGNAGNLGAGTTGTGEGLTITVSIPDMTQFGLTNNLRLVGWNGTGWIDLSEAPTASGNIENSTLRGIMHAGITSIAVGKISPVLPVKLESFNALSSNCNTVLNWKTSGEINSSRFIIEQSFNGTEYNAIASVLAAGTSTGSVYSISVNQPNGLAYYRLKMVDTDGSFSYSPVVINRNECTPAEYMQVYPNPVTSYQNINLSFITAYRGRAIFTLFTTTGQLMVNKPIIVTSGTNIVTETVNRMAAGTYFIKLYGIDGKQIGSTQKFIKQ